MKTLHTVFLPSPLCAGPVLGQTTDYHFNIDENTSIVSWDLVLNLGNVVEQPATFAFDGSMLVQTDVPAAPFGSAVTRSCSLGQGKARPNTV